MTELAVRRLQIDWSEPLPFLWNPENPEFSLQMNATTLVAIAFERYIAVVFKQAIAKLDDAELVVEADAFVVHPHLQALPGPRRPALPPGGRARLSQYTIGLAQQYSCIHHHRSVPELHGLPMDACSAYMTVSA